MIKYLKYYFNLLFIIVVFVSCNGKEGLVNSSDDSLLQGRVVKGPVSNSLVTVYKVDDNTTLGTATTNFDGRFTLDIGGYEGLIKVVSTGGSYRDEVTNNTVASTSLRSFTSISSNDMMVIVSPFTQSAAIQIENMDVSQLTTQLVKSTNENFISSIMGLNFNPAKADPKIFDTTGTNPITNDDGISGEYGIALALFSQLLDNNSLDVESLTQQMVNDVENDTNGSAVDMINALDDLNISDDSIMNEINSSIATVINPSSTATINGLNNKENLLLNTVVQFDLNITGIELPEFVTIDSNGSFLVKENGSSSFENAVYVNNNAIIRVLLQTSNEYNTSVTTTINVGSVEYTLTATTLILPTINTLFFSDDNNITYDERSSVNFTGSTTGIENNQEVFITIGSITQTAIVTDNEFNSTIDLSTLEDNNYAVLADASNSSGISAIQFSMDITILPEIDLTPPVWPSSYNINIDENETFSYELNATDNASTTLMYSIVGGLDEALFSLNGSTLTFLTNKDFENPTDNDFDNIYEVILSTMDEANNETNQSVAITINNVIDEAPVLVNPLAINIDENISSNTVIFQVLKDGNNSDENTTDAFYITNGNDGNFTINSNGEITVSSTSNLDFGINSSYTLTITASNDGGTSESVTLTININNVNEITAIDDNATLDEDSNITINVLNNDLEEDNKQLTVSIATNASNGTAILNNNQIIYTPNENYFGVDTIEYTVSNNEDEANATVNIVINQINDTPTILNPIANQTAYENNPFLLDTSLYFTDANDTNDTLTFTATNLPSWATIDSNGTITGTPTTASSSVTVTIKATDSGNPPSFVNSDFNLSVDSGFSIVSMDANVSEAKDNDTVEITLNFTDDVNISIANTNDFNISFDINGTIVDAITSITNATNVASYKVLLTIPNSNNLYAEFISINSLFVSSNSIISSTLGIDLNTDGVGTIVTNLIVDTIPPTLTDVSIESNNTDSSLAKIGDLITIDITASEDIQTPQVKINGHVATISIESNTNFTATYTVDSNNSDGNATISIDFNDTVGNVGTQVTTTTHDSFVTIDTTVPTLTDVSIESNNTDSSLAKIGDLITINITASEDIQTPQVKIDNHVATISIESNTNFTATYTVDSNNSDGNATILIDFNDTVGNAGTQVTTTTNDSFVTIDTTVPTLTDVSIESNNTDSSLAKIGDLITINITASEDIQTPQVKINGHVATISIESNTNFTATYTVDSNNSDGNATISIDFNDTVGNVGTQVTTTTNDSFVTIDKTPPTLTVVTIESNNTDSSLAKIGDTITIDITALEDIQTPQVKIDNHVATVTGSNTNFTATYTVDSNNSDGNATISIDFNDTVGNVGTQVTTTTNDSFVIIDATPPNSSSESAIINDADENRIFNSGDTLTLLFSEVINTSLINLTNIESTSGISFGTGATVNTDDLYDSEIVITLGNDTSVNGETIIIPNEQIQDNVGNIALSDISFSVIDFDIPIIEDITMIDDHYVTEDFINVTVLFSDDINVTKTGDITIDLKIGNTIVKAAYNESNSSNNNMVFTYYALSVIDSNGIEVLGNSIVINGSTIKHNLKDADLEFEDVSFPGVTVFAPFGVSAGTAVWYDAADVDGDGDLTEQPVGVGYINEWRDKSGNGYHLTQSAVSGIPRVLPAADYNNNKNAVFFYGNDNKYMNYTGEQIASNESYSWFFAGFARILGDSDYDNGSIFNTKSSNSNGIDVSYYKNGTTHEYYTSIYSGFSPAGYKSEFIGDSYNNIGTILGESFVSNSYRNTYYKGEKTERESVRSVRHGDGITLGAIKIGSNDAFNHTRGKFFELLFYNRALSDAETVIIQNYLSSKWNSEIVASANYYDGDENAMGDYDDYVTGIVKLSTSLIDVGEDDGVTIANDGFVQVAGDSILIGNKGDDSIVTNNALYPSSTNYKKLNKTWYIDIKSNTIDNEGGIKLIFDLSKFNSISETGSASDYALLYASNENGIYIPIANASSMDGSNIEFELTAKTSGTIDENGDTIKTGYFTISSSNDSLLN